MLVLRTLGRLSLEDGPRIVLSGRRKALAFLAYLVRQGGRPVGRDELASLFWANADDARARQSLRTMLTELRDAVGDVLEVDASHVRVPSGAVQMDASLMEAEVARGEFSSAAGRWSGDFLDGLEDLGDDRWRFWLETERTGLRSQLGFALERLSAESELAGEWADAVDYAERWARLVPADERAATRVVRALRTAGRESEATARHAALSRVIEEHTGASPSAVFSRLARARPEEQATPGVRGLLTPDLVGRESALSTLTRAWEEARRGAGRCVVIEGDEGLGKTRLLEEFARFLRTGRGDTTVVVARAYASERARSLAAIRAVLDPLAGAPGASAVPPALLASLGTVSPAIAERFPKAGHERERPVGVDEAFARLIGEVAFEGPLAILLDDAPVADPASLDVIARLALRTPDRVLLVLSGTPDAWLRVGITGEVQRAAHMSRVQLRPLAVDETRRFAESVLPLAPNVGQELSARLHAETGGRPALLQLAMRQLVERGSLSPGPSGRWTLAGSAGDLSLSVHGAVSDQLRQRIADLDDSSRRVLEAAAVVGPRIDPALLEHVSGVTADDYRTATADLLARRLLRRSLTADGPIEFGGEAERRSVYDGITPSTRRAYHRAAARALRASSAGDRHRAEIAEHRRRGGTDPRRSVAMAVGGVAVALAAILGARTIIGAPAGMPPGTQLLLANVQNLTPDSTLGGTLDLAARIGLQQSRHVSLITASQVNDALARMKRDNPVPAVDERLAHEIAARENLPAFIHLAIASVDSSYLLTGRVIDPAQGRDLFSTSATAEGRGAILDALDRVLKRVRRSLGESRVVARDQSLPRVTTASLEALRLYAEGRALWARGLYDPAKSRWVQAVSLDSSFALALTSIGDFYYYKGDSGIDRRAGDLYLDRALANAHRLTERERLALHGTIARLRGTPEDALRHARELAERFPDRDAWYSVGTHLMRQSRGKDAIGPLRRSVELDSMFYGGWINLAASYQLADQVDSALVAYSRAARADSGRLYRGGNVNQEWGRALILAGREAAAESVYRIAATVGLPANRAQGLRTLAWLEMYRGRYREAQRALEAAIVLVEREPQALAEARNRWILASMLHDLGDRAGARAQLDRAEARLGGMATAPIFVYYLARERLRAGEVAGARRLLRRMEAAANMQSPLERSLVALLRGEISLFDGRADSAIADARRCECDPNITSTFRDQLLSSAYERLSRTDSALAAAKRLEALWPFGYEAQPAWRHAGLRIARLSLAAGDTAGAVSALERQLDRWKMADTEFPDLVEARRMFAVLRARRE